MRLLKIGSVKNSLKKVAVTERRSAFQCNWDRHLNKYLRMKSLEKQVNSNTVLSED